MSPNYSPSLGNRATTLGLKATVTMESKLGHGDQNWKAREPAFSTGILQLGHRWG